MAKAVNWPKEFYDEIVNEDSDSPRIALRLGTLYYDNAYYYNGEIIDIRVNHKVTRKGKIMDDTIISRIKDLSDDILAMNKSRLREKTNIISFLAETYSQPVDEDTVVTVIKYKNLPPEECDEIDDPHVD